ncbi:MAG: type II toxin-antitoxin system VapC family toxin [Actinomycetota bacterium]|nr:type II toxin-antitoxin system VapC family toxin [Actinomycetota bacterium]
MEIVLDASIAVKWFSAKSEDNVEIALEIQRQKILDKLEIMVPDLFFLEITNAFLTRSKFSIDDILMIEESLHKMNLKVIYPDHTILNSAIRIAHTCGLTMYDSFYVAIAKFCEVPLLTGDKKILDNRNKFEFIKSPEEFKKILL